MKSLPKTITGAAAFVLLFLILVVAVHNLFTTKVPGANDFYSRWKGAELFWLEGIDPYSEAAGEAIQRGMYGRLAYPDEDQVLFVYPFYTAFLLIPLVGLPYDWVQAIWLVTLVFSLIAGIVFSLRLVDWRQPPWLLGITLLWTVVVYNSARTIILGQFAGLIFLWLAGAMLALKRERDILAGFLLALTTIKPQMSFLIIPALLVWGAWQRRWWFVAGFSGAMGVLVGLSFLFLPGWLTGFLDQVNAYPGYTFTGSPIWVLTGYLFPQLGRPVEIGLSALAVLFMLYEWRRLPKVTAVADELIFLTGLTLIVTNLIVVRTATTNYVIMYIPLIWVLKKMADRLRGGNVITALFLLFSAIGTWVLFLATIQGDLEHPINYLPLPLGFLIWLIWEGRRFNRADRIRSPQR